MRLVGQMHEIAVPLPDRALDRGQPARAAGGVRGRLHRPLRRPAARRPDRGGQLPRHRHRADAVARRCPAQAHRHEARAARAARQRLVRRRLLDRAGLRPLRAARGRHDRRPRHRGGARGHHHRRPRRHAARRRRRQPPHRHRRAATAMSLVRAGMTARRGARRDRGRPDRARDHVEPARPPWSTRCG